MTALLFAACGSLFAYALYLATICARARTRPGEFLHANLEIPSWVYIFGATGVILASLNLYVHLLLVSLFGLQYSHVAVGLVVAALCAALLQKRVWLASRITGLITIGELIGDYLDSRAVRVVFLAILFLFSVPFAAYSLAEIGALIAAASDGVLLATQAIWIVAFFLFLYSVIGGWRAVAYVVAAQSLLILALLFLMGGFIGAAFDPVSFAVRGIATVKPILSDRIPGVIQFSDGIGKEASAGGLWTTTLILSFALTMIGMTLSPGFSFLAITTSSRRRFSFGQIWMIAGLAAGALLLVAPIIGAELASAGSAFELGYSGLIGRIADLDRLAAVGLFILLLASLQIGVAFFAASGASIVTIELVHRYMLPGLAPAGQKLAAQIVLAALYGIAALTASFAPAAASVLASLAISLSAQMLPAFLALCWLPWISRQAVLTGLILGALLVGFTEPFGLVAFESLFVDLPWGRWPLTVHSAAWGLFFNLAACLLVSVFTRGGAERDHRERLHSEVRREVPARVQGAAVLRAKWSVVLIWLFLALGPGAILGNSFFSEPIFAGGTIDLGFSSLLTWQVFFWSAGVLIVWWLAQDGRIGAADEAPLRSLILKPPPSRLFLPPVPGWISKFLDRIAAR